MHALTRRLTLSAAALSAAALLCTTAAAARNESGIAAGTVAIITLASDSGQ